MGTPRPRARSATSSSLARDVCRPSEITKSPASEAARSSSVPETARARSVAGPSGVRRERSAASPSSCAAKVRRRTSPPGFVTLRRRSASFVPASHRETPSAWAACMLALRSSRMIQSRRTRSDSCRQRPGLSQSTASRQRPAPRMPGNPQRRPRPTPAVARRASQRPGTTKRIASAVASGSRIAGFQAMPRAGRSALMSKRRLPFRRPRGRGGGSALRRSRGSPRRRRTTARAVCLRANPKGASGRFRR